jgi:hypothetical protein
MGQILTIELPTDIYEAIKKAASENGQTPSDWISAELPRLFAAQQAQAQEKVAGNKTAVPLYHFYENAIDTGIVDLAEQHDHYLYGQSKHSDDD